MLPSRHDSFGRVVVEAMATGLPAIVSEHVGAKEMIAEGENGWIVPSEDAEVLAQKMQWRVKHSGKVAEKREKAVEAARKYTWKAYRRRVVDVIFEALDSADENLEAPAWSGLHSPPGASSSPIEARVRSTCGGLPGDSSLGR